MAVSVPEVLVVGDANPDLLLTGDVVPRFGQAEQIVGSAELLLGGSASIVACGLAKLGVATGLAASVGRDAYGDFVLDELSRAGVDTRWVRVDPETPTGISVILSAHDRAILTYPGTVGSTGPEVVDPDALEHVRHVHSASYFLQPRLGPHMAGLFRRTHEFGGTTSLDTNWDPAQRWAGVLDLLDDTDVFLPNRAELLAVTRQQDVDAAARCVLDRGSVVALKDGADGGVLWGLDGEQHRSAVADTDVRDTTGAGDSFDAGYLSAMLEGLDGPACLERATRCGSLSTRRTGGTAAQATIADLAE